MRISSFLHRSLSATVAAALVIGAPATANAAPAKRRPVGGRFVPVSHVGTPPVGTLRPTNEVVLSTGQGELLTLPAAVSDVWVSNPTVADVYVNNPRQIHLFGKDFGEATVFATNASGAVIYSANIRVSQNLTSIDKMMRMAMPDAHITVTTVGQIAVLTGTVASPEDSAQAQRLATAILNPGASPTSDAGLKIGVINRLRVATPLQVNLQVRIAEVSRSFVKNIGVNLQSFDKSGGFNFGVTQGRGASTQYTPGGPLFSGVTSASPGTSLLTGLAGATTIGAAGNVLGLDLISALDLGERDGQVSTLANPNITVISGETASFLAGGEIPIPISQGLGAVSVEFKQYGVSLSYTPTVLADGRISMRVRPEVSQLTSDGAVTINGTTIPALSTRRAETTVEMGSGQSMMIGGLLQNSHNNSITKAPGVGDVPVIGALFRSNAFQRNETELMIVITPYLVKPVNANDIVLPTDGEKAPSDLGRVFMGQVGAGTTGGDRPKPRIATPGEVQPALGATTPLPLQPTPTPPTQQRREEPVSAIPAPSTPSKKGANPTPGFSIN